MVNLDNDNILFLTKLFRPKFTKISKQRNKSAPNFRATQAINVKVKSKIKQFQIVGNSPENLKSKMLIQFYRIQNR